MTYDDRAGTGPTAWGAWILFAAVILVVNGAVAIIEGLAGIFRDEAFFGPGEALVLDQATWGWIHLVIGILLVAVGVGLYRGARIARVLAVVLAMVNLVAHFTSLGVSPWWSIVAIALDVLIIYALVVHGEALTSDP